MANAGSVIVNLGANTAAFTRGLNKAKGETTSFMSSFKQGIGLGAGFSAVNQIAAKAVSVIDSVFDKYADLNKVGEMADKLGVGVEALQGLQVAAKGFDIDNEMLGKGLLHINSTVQEAADGSAEAAKKLAAFGLSAKQLKGLSLDQDFLKIAEAASKMPSDQLLAAASNLFGERATDLVKVLALGSDGIRRMADQAKKLGAIATDAQIASAGKLDDALDKMHLVWDGVRIQLGDSIVPLVTDMTTALIDCAPALRGMAEAADGLAKGVGFIGRAWKHETDWLASWGGWAMNKIGLVDDEEFQRLQDKAGKSFKEIFSPERLGDLTPMAKKKAGMEHLSGKAGKEMLSVGAFGMDTMQAYSQVAKALSGTSSPLEKIGQKQLAALLGIDKRLGNQQPPVVLETANF